jgi:hypothetical protein
MDVKIFQLSSSKIDFHYQAMMYGSQHLSIQSYPAKIFDLSSNLAFHDQAMLDLD